MLSNTPKVSIYTTNEHLLYSNTEYLSLPSSYTLKVDDKKYRFEQILNPHPPTLLLHDCAK